MKSVLISIQPKWCELIASGKKTVEVRKTKPKLETPFKVYIYCTQGEALAYPCLNNPKFAIHRKNNSTLQGRQMTAKERERSDHSYANGKVIGEFVCDYMVDSPIWRLRGNTGFLAPRTEREKNLPEMACLTLEELKEYVGSENKCVCGWHISDLVIYDKPKDLSQVLCRKQAEKCVNACEHNGMCQYCKEIRPPQSWCYVESEDTE